MEITIKIIIRSLGLLFIISGLSKAFNLRAFSAEIAQYCEFYINIWLIKYRLIIAVIFCVIEIIMGVLSFIGKTRVISSLFFFFILLFFMFLTGMNYLFSPKVGTIETCGCFGELIHFTPETSFYKSFSLWIFSTLNIILVFIQYKAKRREINITK